MTEPTPQQLQAEIARLQQQLAEFQSRQSGQVAGSGAMVQGGSVGAGAYGTAIGTIQGNAYFGPEPEDPAAALRIYRQVYVASCRQLPLRGVDVGASDPKGNRKQIDLDQVYIALDTTAQIDEETLQRSLADPQTLLRFNLPKGGAIERVALQAEKQRQEDKLRPLPVLTAVIASPRAVLLGAPGSGKSTFAGHLGLCLALHGLDPTAGWLDRLPGWPAQADVIPISVLLRDFAHSLPQAKGRATPQLLWDFIVDRLASQNLQSVAKPLHDALEGGRAIVLLDGLDEVPSRGQRSHVRDAVAAFAQRYPRSRLAVTCRTLSYQDAVSQLEGIPVYELAPFDEPKIDQFINAWYQELAGAGVVKAADVDRLTKGLRAAVRRPDLRRLAPNPLLLTVMALVHTHKGQLPDARALLYEETVDILLWRWEQIKPGSDEDQPALHRLLQVAGRTDVDLKRVLWRMAFEVHRQSRAGDGEALADIGELQLEKALAELHPERSRDWAAAVVEAMKLRAGLLLERAPEVYTFPHRTFQEYLAGAHLATQANFAAQAVKQMTDPALWWEVILLAAGRLVYLVGDTDKPLALVGELCPGHGADTRQGWKQATLAGDVLREIGINRVQESVLGQDLLDRVQGRLVDALATDKLTAKERALAGVTLAKLGDPRKEVTTVEHMPFCLVPGGTFWMGDGKEQHRCETAVVDFWIGRYPVTNAQYILFIQAGGYGHDSYWREAKQAGFWRPGEFKGRYDSAWRSGPVESREPFGLPNHPVVGVTWYEALAFTRWLTDYLCGKQLLASGWAIQLPSEAEWEKAARGGWQVAAGPVYRSPEQGLEATVSPVNNLSLRSTIQTTSAPTPGWMRSTRSGRTTLLPGLVRPVQWAAFPAAQAHTASKR